MDKTTIKGFVIATLAYTAVFMMPPAIYAATHAEPEDTSQKVQDCPAASIQAEGHLL